MLPPPLRMLVRPGGRPDADGHGNDGAGPRRSAGIVAGKNLTVSLTTLELASEVRLRARAGLAT
jgi:hypothetical protein